MDKPVDGFSDEALMELVLQQDHAAFAQLVSRHTSRFYALAYRTLFDKVAAEDMVQEAFLKLWRQPEQWNHNPQGARFTTWFYRVVLNACLDFNKKKRPFRLQDDFDVADDSSQLEANAARQQQRQLVDQAIAALPEKQRTALNLCFFEKRSNQQAADIMGISLKALQSLLIRAKAALREQVGLVSMGVKH